MIVCGTNSLFSKLCLAMDAPELLDDERFAAGPVRFENRAELRIALEGYLRKKTRAEWLTILSQAGVPASPVNHVDEMMEEAQAQSVDILRTLNGSVDPFQTARLPIRFNGQRAEYEATALDWANIRNLCFARATGERNLSSHPSNNSLTDAADPQSEQGSAERHALLRSSDMTGQAGRTEGNGAVARCTLGPCGAGDLVRDLSA